MAPDLETIVKQLADSGIIAAETLKNFVPPKASPKTPDELVQALVKSDKLTNFQGQQVKAGKAKALSLGAYTILDKIGAGGMGQVFKAEHRKMKRLVAIKMLPPTMTKDAAALARFQREVEAAAKLRHPNVVAADDAAEANGVHFLVMEYVEGKDLSATVIKDGPLPVNKAVNYILQAARGLEFAHGEGVVHRDIKPANLLLDKKGVVKILDMGLARIESGGDTPAQAELTGTGMVMGTVDYMAPEQALSTRQADARADIYSLGISLYYLIAGRAPYDGETLMAKLLAHREQPIPSLQDAQATVPKQLDAIFKKMVAKQIDDRYQSTSKVIEALEGLRLAGSIAGSRGEVASTLALSSTDRKKLATKTTKKPLGSLTEVVGSEKTKHLFAKIVGGTFATIVAPILVTYLIRYLDKKDEPHTPPAANAPLTAPSVVVATSTASRPVVPVTSSSDQPKTTTPPLAAVASSVPAIGTLPTALTTGGPAVASVAPQPGSLPAAEKSLSLTQLLTSPDYEWTEPERLDNVVNYGQKFNFSPRVSNNGLEMWHSGSGSKVGASKGSIAGKSEFFISRRKTLDAPWERAESVGPPINTSEDQLDFSLSGDRRSLFFSGGSGILFSSRVALDQPWSEPTNAPGLNDKDHVAPVVLPDGLMLYFSTIKRKGGLGGYDIVMTKRDTPATNWPRADVLPAPVNSSSDDRPCWVSVDGKVLILSSNRDGSLGKKDLWVAVRKVTTDDWQTPVNLGPAVNGPNDEICADLSPDGRTLWFTKASGDGTAIYESRLVKKPVAAAP